MTIADTTWLINSTPLESRPAYWLISVDESLPPRVGDNVRLAGQNGRRYTAKSYDQRTLSMIMMVDAVPPGGGARTATQLATNLAAVETMLCQNGTFTLKRTHGGVAQEATAEVRQLKISPGGPYHYLVGVELELANPWWYAAADTTASKTLASLPTTLAVANGGIYTVDRSVISWGGPITNPKILIGSSWVQYIGTVAVGNTLVLNTDTFSALIGVTNVIANITWATGYARWLEIPAGSNTATISGTVGASSPTVQVVFRAVLG